MFRGEGGRAGGFALPGGFGLSLAFLTVDVLRWASWVAVDTKDTGLLFGAGLGLALRGCGM